jgi:hydrogenase expression/formation protein HypD
MSSPQQWLDAIHQVPLDRALRILHLSGDQERVIVRAGIRERLPAAIELLAGPGSPAMVCPAGDVYQAIQLARRHPLTLFVEENLLHLPLGPQMLGPGSLAAAREQGADVRVVAAPVEAFLAARGDPAREMVLFVAGFETLLAPLAGLLLEDVPENLSLLLCGRSVAPLLEQQLQLDDPGFDGLLLPGNRCAVIGSAGWETLIAGRRLPAAIGGYTASAVLRAVHAVARRRSERRTGIDNCYRPVARPEGNAVARRRLEQVFARANGHWRGYGDVPASAYRLGEAHADQDADRRYPDYRAEVASAEELAAGCRCAEVMLGRERPADCAGFAGACDPVRPQGPCMASPDGTCHINMAP